jgi:hypothetical protein
VRKALLPALVAVLGLAAIAMAGPAGAARSKTFHFTERVTGASISSTHAAFKIHDSRVGNGAGVQTISVNSTGTGGTDREITYYGNATARSHGTFTLGTPDVNGIAKLTGQGHDTGGTGKLRGFKSTYTFTGTFNTKTLVFTVVLHGTGSTS